MVIIEQERTPAMPPLMRRIFWFLNKFFMVPMFRLGFAPFFGNPFTGYIMVMKVIGRKTGKARFTPVNYAIYKGDVYCVSGGRAASDWFRNLLANPEADLILPGGSVYARAEEAADPKLKLILVRQILKNAGFAGFFEGYNPFAIADDELARKIEDLPLLRFRPLGIGGGPSDAGGWAWVWLFGIAAILIV
ncbi:MAG: nitroreductase/quinone reductase family protein, partial [Chloroflexi bacterium]|nr:nitroreductase/quinone reductase family protein [Chloroflexota bacterium]